METKKVSELAVELSIESKELVNLLKDMGFAGKSAKSKMEESFFTGLKNVYPHLTRKEAEKQYHGVYSMIEKELKELRLEPAREKKILPKKDFSMEW